MTVICPSVVGKLLKAANSLDRVDADKERFCYLVTDEEWYEILDYAYRFQFDRDATLMAAKSMHFCGIEVIKRSAVLA